MNLYQTADYIIPPAEYSSIFVMTNFIETKQAHGVCDEDFMKNDCLCKTDSDCAKIETNNGWNGIQK